VPARPLARGGRHRPVPGVGGEGRGHEASVPPCVRKGERGGGCVGARWEGMPAGVAAR